MDDESKYGFILPNLVRNYSQKSHKYLSNLVLFQPKSITYKGKILWYGKINEFFAFGIQTSEETDMGTNGTFNKLKIFQCQNRCGVIVKDSVKILKIDESDHFVIDYNIGDINVVKCQRLNSNDIIVVNIDYKLKVAKYCDSILINDIQCYRVEFMGDNNMYIYRQNDILGKFTDDNGIVNVHYSGTYSNVEIVKHHRYNLEDMINLECGSVKISGIVKWIGTINKYLCLGICPKNKDLISDYRRHLDIDDAYWTVVCLDMLEIPNIYKVPKNFTEVVNPKEKNIFTYFKLKGYIQIANQNDKDGVVEKYAFDNENNFFYGIKLDDEDNLKFFPLDDVKCATPFDIKERAFFEVNNPAEFGIETIFQFGDRVEIKPTKYNKLKENCFGIIVWMGFDKDFSLKFYLQLDKPNEAGDDGILFGEKIYDVNDKCGLLVLPSCLSPVITKTDNTYKIVSNYVNPRWKISFGIKKGIQGDKNSCYLDTSLFAMFTFHELFDNLLLTSSKNKDNTSSDVQKILGSHIIFPLRSEEYVSYAGVNVFRQKLGEIFPTKKFIHSERDPEELMESLFHLLTPNDPLLHTFHLKNKVKQSCFLTQLFFMAKNLKETTISEMINRTFLEGDILIDKPPKCLILQLPRDGNQYRQYKEVNISSYLNITHLIRCCFHKCNDCSKQAMFFCKSCSEKDWKFIYFCSDHKINCNHDKIDIQNENEANSELRNNQSSKPKSYSENRQLFNGEVILKLFAILCIEKTHYVAYVRTGEVMGKWIYFDSMGKLDNHELQPEIRETFIESYFTKGTVNDDNFEDVQRIKSYAFVCFYKNPAMEFYSRDFNHIDLN